MKLNDRQVGKPEHLFAKTKTEIESLSSLSAGAFAYATDTSQIGSYIGGSWDWARPGESLSPAPAGSVLDRDTDSIMFYDSSASQVRQSLISDLIDTFFGASINVAGDITQDSTFDIYPAGMGLGLANRLNFLPNLQITDIEANFLPGETTGSGNGSLTEYAFAGSPFVTATTQTYNTENDYMSLGYTGGNYRVFLYRGLGSPASAWQNISSYGRFRTGINTAIGFRIDDGTDDNYTEVYVDGDAGDGTQSLAFEYRTGGGAASKNSSNIIVPCNQFLSIRLLRRYSSPNYNMYAYIMGEDWSAINIAGFNTPNIVWPPTDGRIGIIVKNETGAAGNPAFCDWFRTGGV